MFSDELDWNDEYEKSNASEKFENGLFWVPEQL